MSESLRLRTDYIVWHCSATKPSQDIGVTEIDLWHKRRGWDGVGYHLIIRRDGRLEPGRHLGVPGAHVKGFNQRSVGICMVGGISPQGGSENNFTSEQWNTASIVQHFLETLYPDAETVGHKDLNDGKDCPCFDARSVFK